MFGSVMLYAAICDREGTTTTSEGSTSCDITVTNDGSGLDSLDGAVDYEYALLLSFGVVLDGALLEAVSRSTTGINGSSEGIVAVLVKSDTATALNVSVGSVQVLGVQQLDSRQLLVNVSATVPVAGEVQEQQDGVAADAQDLAAGGYMFVAHDHSRDAAASDMPPEPINPVCSGMTAVDPNSSKFSVLLKSARVVSLLQMS